jgi:hypothetical protein
MRFVRFSWYTTLIFLAAPGLAQTVNFNAPRTFSRGGNPNYGNPELCMSVADFNGDGKPDLIWRTVEEYVTVLLSNGDGSFQTLPSVYFGRYVNCFAVGDFNGDGKADLAVLLGGPQQGPSGRTVSIMLGNGDGTFQPPQDYRAGEDPSFVAVGDFNGDGKLDLAVTNKTSNSVSILLGNGDGTFRPQAFYASQMEPVFVAVGDFNGDGKADLAVSNGGSNSVSILQGNGDGTFRQAKSYATEVGPAAVSVGDFNGDGKADLAVVNWGSNTVSILLGNGDGSFRPQTAFGAGRAPNAVAVADLNGDGKLDLAVTSAPTQLSSGSSVVTILLGKGDGTFQPSVNYAPGGFAVAIADFNGDGKPDLAVAAFAMTILLGRGNGIFERPVSYSVSSFPNSVAAGDFDGDGKPDLAIPNYFSNDVSILLNKGNGAFQPRVNYPVLVHPVAAAVGDFNGDGRPDLAVVYNNESNAVSILLGNGNGTFRPMVNYTVGGGPGGGGGGQTVAVSDFNGDGKLDLAVVNWGGSISILLGNGDGTFQPQSQYTAGEYPGSLAVADVNGDGKSDLVVYNSTLSNPYFSVLPGHGDGTFGAPILSPVNPDGAFFIGVTDFNGDGVPDLAAGTSIYLGQGDGTFIQGSYLSSGRVSAIGDFDGDGNQDVALAGGEGVSIFLGNGKGTFAVPMSFLTANTNFLSAPTFLTVADFNGDGKPDLAVANAGSNDVAVLTNIRP